MIPSSSTACMSRLAYAINVGSNGAVHAPSTVITACSVAGVIVTYNAYAYIDGSSLTGTGAGGSFGLLVQGGWASQFRQLCFI